MNIKLISLAQLIGWILFVFTDYIEETTHNDFFLITIYLMPVAADVLYLIFDKKCIIPIGQGL